MNYNKKTIGIIMGEPNSIFSELIFKIWKNRKKNKLIPFILIGNYLLIKKQMLYLGYNFSLLKIDTEFTNLKKNTLLILDVKFNQKKSFEKVSNKSNSLITKSFEIGIRLIKQKKIFGLINGPICKETFLSNKYNGMTEFISSKIKNSGKEVMLIYNNELSVVPLTTHIPVKKISGMINKKMIVEKVKTVNSFYKKIFKKKAIIGITGLNPHCYTSDSQNEEKKIIRPAIRELKKKKININGPISGDTIFLKKNRIKYDVIVGMYHDQVLAPLKSLYSFKAINITLGLPFIRVTPDHGIGSDIIKKKIADPSSLLECMKFFKKIK
jgi:4-hydroxythreonine-4-phosphate dehydrogenase|tara:strand:+ start:11317 stop:12291 length:975 start_codon:yes stop_codon:yes gene_type:complete